MRSSLFFFLLLRCVFLLSRCVLRKEYIGLWYMGIEKEGECHGIKCPSPPTSCPFLYFFSHVLFSFSYTFLLSNSKGIIARRGSWALWDLKGCVWSIDLSFIFCWFWLNFRYISVDLHEFSRTWPGPSSHALSIQHLYLWSNKWFDVTDINVAYPCVDIKYDVYLCCAHYFIYGSCFM